MYSSIVPGRGLVEVGETIVSSTEQYKVEEILGAGSFGVVSLCRKSSTDQKVALKIIKHTEDPDEPDEESLMLKRLMDKGGARFNIVQLFGSFNFKNKHVHEFEALDISLADFVFDNGPLQLKAIRPIIAQMGRALSFLKRLGIVHADLKPDNIMMVDRISKPLQVKLIDFGLALHVDNIDQCTNMQTMQYRAPEVFLGVLCDHAIDTWSTGCIIMEMFLRENVFYQDTDYKTFCLLIETVGLPGDHLLFKGLHTHEYLTYQNSCWSFRGSKVPVPTSKSLYGEILSAPLNGADEGDRVLFLNLMIQMLNPDPAKRISPEMLLRHPFVTLENVRHLDPDYVLESKKIMCEVLCDVLCEDKRRKEVDTRMDAGPSVAQTAPSSHKRPREDKDRIEEESRSHKRHCVEPPCVSKGFVTATRKRVRV